MDQGDLLDEIKPQSRALRRHVLGAPHLVKLAEDLFRFSLFDSHAVVGNADVETIFLGNEGNVDPGPVGLIVFDRIGEQVHEQHLEQRPVDPVVGPALGGVVDGDVAPPKQIGVLFAKFFNHFNNIDTFPPFLITLRLDPGQIEDAVDIRQQAVDVVAHEAQVAELVFPGQIVA